MWPWDAWFNMIIPGWQRPITREALVGRGRPADENTGTGPDGGGYRSMSHGAARYSNEVSHGVAPTRPFYKVQGDLD